MRFAMRRAALGLLLLLGVSLLAVGLLELAPGDYLDEMKVDPSLAPETLEQWREQYGLNQGIATRYGRWAQSVLRGEFGMSLAYGRPVSELLAGRVGNTARLALGALVLAWMTALPLGAWCAAYPSAWAARAIGAAVSAVLALPDLLVALRVLPLPLWLGIGPWSGRIARHNGARPGNPAAALQNRTFTTTKTAPFSLAPPFAAACSMSRTPARSSLPASSSAVTCSCSRTPAVPPSPKTPSARICSARRTCPLPPVAAT
ncbi:MAG: ABC transporter permease [Bryobacterales bacterium]|nr:ABC transporter permease [Bryobacterales bacterium]